VENRTAKFSQSDSRSESDSEASALAKKLDRYLRSQVIDWDSPNQKTYMGICDLSYSRFLLGHQSLRHEEHETLYKLLKVTRLAGEVGNEPHLNVHLSAYILGAINLSDGEYLARYKSLLSEKKWDWRLLFNPTSLHARWPSKYSHHSWRVSHWVGGAPSIAMSLWAKIPDVCRAIGLPPLEQLLVAADDLVHTTGMLKTYKSNALQQAFRSLYRIRHDPNVGDVGGIVHLHWVNYASGRGYKNGDRLYASAWELMKRAPFIEKVPYCLDFDIVQIVRTASSTHHHAVHERSRRYSEDIVHFLAHNDLTDYPLHKLPGALATIHECALITGDAKSRGLSIAPIDIIKQANWI